jgi:hypothetical protein
MRYETGEEVHTVARAGARSRLLIAAALVAATAAVACQRNAIPEAPAATSSPPAGNVYTIAYVANTPSALPKCGSANAGTTAFVQSPIGLFSCIAGIWVPIPCSTLIGGAVAYASASQTLLACVSSQWTIVPLPPGPQGPQGQTGPMGVMGSTGATGATGAPGATPIVVQVPVSPGTQCANGGTELDSGVDGNGDGQLTGTEIASRSVVCNGATGATGPAGQPTLVTSQAVSPGGACALGGVELTFGVDTNGDGKIEPGEATSFSFLCNGGGGSLGAPTVPTLPTTAGTCDAADPCPSGYFCDQGGTCDLKAVQVAVGLTHSCALLGNGTLQCWSIGGTPVALATIDGATAITAGGPNPPCAVMSDGTVECDASRTGFTGRFVPVPGLTGVVAIAAGSEHVCALKSDGTVWCWGDNSEGELGDGTGLRSLTPVRALVAGAVAIAAGVSTHETCALLATGAVACWGAPAAGLTASAGGWEVAPHLTATAGSVAHAALIGTPVMIPTLTGATAVAVNAARSCAVVGSTFVQCWTTPGGTVSDLPGFTGIATTVALGGGGGGTIDKLVATGVGTAFVCGLAPDGTVACAGDNSLHQLGDGSIKDVQLASPAVVPQLANVTALAEGVFTTCALRSDGSVVCWGQNAGPRPKSVGAWGKAKTCAGDEACASGVCLGGFCCDAPCGATDASCAATACDGTGACVYPDGDTSCGTPSCTGAALTAGTCDGAGSCAVTTAACPNQLACNTTDNVTCLVACASDADCAPGNVCDATSTTCVPSASPTQPDGGTTDPDSGTTPPDSGAPAM